MARSQEVKSFNFAGVTFATRIVDLEEFVKTFASLNENNELVGGLPSNVVTRDGITFHYPIPPMPGFADVPEPARKAVCTSYIRGLSGIVAAAKENIIKSLIDALNGDDEAMPKPNSMHDMSNGVDDETRTLLLAKYNVSWDAEKTSAEKAVSEYLDSLNGDEKKQRTANFAVTIEARRKSKLMDYAEKQFAAAAAYTKPASGPRGGRKASTDGVSAEVIELDE